MTTNLNVTISTNAELIRRLCIRENYYTRGTNEDYYFLLGLADKQKNLTDETLEYIAWNIITHSFTEKEYIVQGNGYVRADRDLIDNVKFKILNDATIISLNK